MTQTPDSGQSQGEPVDADGMDAAQPSEPPGIAADVSAVLTGLGDRPVEEHPEVYEAIHRRLGDTLSGIDHV